MSELMKELESYMLHQHECENYQVVDLIQQTIQQLQSSQSECAALKVQVNELRDILRYKILGWREQDRETLWDVLKEMEDSARNGLLKAKEQPIAAHDNEVIEKCENAIVECGCIDPYTPIEAIRNLKTEG